MTLDDNATQPNLRRTPTTPLLVQRGVVGVRLWQGQCDAIWTRGVDLGWLVFI